MPHERNHHDSQHPGPHAHDMGRMSYGRLTVMALLSFVSMFFLMYAMVDSLSNVYINVNQFYMAGLMAAPMVVIEIAVMASMYQNRKLNIAFIAASVVVLTVCWVGIRIQAGVGDRQFLRSMIPHHAGALLMCDGASISDPRIKKLCEEIRESQIREIAQMKALLQEHR